MLFFFKKWIKVLFISLMLIPLSGQSAKQALLTSVDVSRVMDQIFAQHVDQREISDTILRHAFQVYIDQFDPHRSYLLEQEVRPWLDLSDAKIKEIAQQYTAQNFIAFANLNSDIQKSIERSRKLLQEVENDPKPLFYGNNIAAQKTPNEKIPFARDEETLKTRIQKNLIEFINTEKQQYGDKQVLDNPRTTLAIYNNFMRERENNYLFVDQNGVALPSQEKENQFIFHVIKALASSLDAHTTFYDNMEANRLKLRLEKGFEGIGVILNQQADGSVVIAKMLEGSPADKSGLIRNEDRILEINGKSVAGEPLNKIVEILRGENSPTLSLVLQRQGNEKIAVSLERAPITVNEDRVQITETPFGNGIIGTIKMDSFYQGDNGITSERDMRKAIRELSKNGNLRGLILDFRDNGGGFLNQAVKIAGLFISSGVIVISKYSNGLEHYYRDMDGKIEYNGPLLILTSRATASAAEIVAQALQDYGVALVVGDEQTFGKGTIQSQTVTDDNAPFLFKTTVGEYYTVSGKTPQRGGVKANILIPGVLNNKNIGEKFLDNALPEDRIAAEYNDDLSDVEPELKYWYSRYYLPTLQHKVQAWDPFLPTLQQKSADRLANNSNYQKFLNRARNNGGRFTPEEDMQMAEAVNVVKDMATLQTLAHNRAETMTAENQK